MNNVFRAVATALACAALLVGCGVNDHNDSGGGPGGGGSQTVSGLVAASVVLRSVWNLNGCWRG